MSKFLLNLLLQISKALVNSKIQFLIQKFFFLTFGPANHAAHSAFCPASPLASLPPQAETAPAGPPSPRVGHVFTGIRFPFWFAPSELAASPSSLCQAGPGCQLCPPPPAARAHPRRHRAPPSSAPRVPPSRYHLAFIFPPLIPLLNSPPSSMVLKPLMPALTPPATP
jgi:hypothetical protein